MAVPSIVDVSSPGHIGLILSSADKGADILSISKAVAEETSAIKIDPKQRYIMRDCHEVWGFSLGQSERRGTI